MKTILKLGLGIGILSSVLIFVVNKGFGLSDIDLSVATFSKYVDLLRFGEVSDWSSPAEKGGAYAGGGQHAAGGRDEVGRAAAPESQVSDGKSVDRVRHVHFLFGWGFYALSATKAIFRARTYLYCSHITYSVRWWWLPVLDEWNRPSGVTLLLSVECSRVDVYVLELTSKVTEYRGGSRNLWRGEGQH